MARSITKRAAAPMSSNRRIAEDDETRGRENLRGHRARRDALRPDGDGLAAGERPLHGAVRANHRRAGVWHRRARQLCAGRDGDRRRRPVADDEVAGDAVGDRRRRRAGRDLGRRAAAPDGLGVSRRRPRAGRRDRREPRRGAAGAYLDGGYGAARDRLARVRDDHRDAAAHAAGARLDRHRPARRRPGDGRLGDDVGAVRRRRGARASCPNASATTTPTRIRSRSTKTSSTPR